MAEARWNPKWNVRPSEEARNFNPAFCAELIGRSVCEYHKSRQKALSIATAYLILPLVLHMPTRQILPRKSNTAFGTWAAENSPLLAEFPDRVGRLLRVSREAVLFSVRHKMLKIHEGGLVPGDAPVRLTAKVTPTTDDVDEARSAAMLLGRWFAAQATESAILQGFGVAP